MPQLGETVTEGTITRWFKAVGDTVAVDEPLFEVSTDKVDSEVPSPAAGVLTEILVPEGETVQVGARLAVLDGSGTDGGGAAASNSASTVPKPAEPDAAAPEPAPSPAATPRPAPVSTAPPPPPTAVSTPPPARSRVKENENDRAAAGVTSPIVRRLIEASGVDPTSIRGTGEGGRITRRDVEAASRAGGATASPKVAPGPIARTQSGDERIPFGNIRRRTAEHMVRSKATSAHVYTSVEVDFERVERVRRAHGGEWKEREGFSLTYLPFISRALCDAIVEFPRVNASIDGELLVVHHAVNLGIAVDLDFQGLIAPVIRDADGKRLWLLAREVRDLASRARSKQLSPDEVLGGTFTVTNPGPYGSLMTLPIINQPQVAILSTDGIAKRPVVVEGPDGEDAVVVHHVGVLALAWDHRAFDGAYASSFLNAIKEIIETRDWEAELA